MRLHNALRRRPQAQVAWGFVNIHADGGPGVHLLFLRSNLEQVRIREIPTNDPIAPQREWPLHLWIGIDAFFHSRDAERRTCIYDK